MKKELAGDHQRYDTKCLESSGNEAGRLAMNKVGVTTCYSVQEGLSSKTTPFFTKQLLSLNVTSRT